MSSATNVGIYVQPKTGDVSVTGNVLPSACNVYDLGSAERRWNDLYLSGNTIDLGGTKISRDANGGGIRLASASGETVDSRVKNLFADGTITASNLNIVGDYVTMRTTTSNTEMMVIENAGTGPALKVTQTGVNSIAEFYDDGGVLALKIADGGNVGIGVTNPVSRLVVSGASSFQGNTTIGNDSVANQHSIQGYMYHTYNGTQTALIINQKSTGKIFELQDFSVPVLTVLDGGNVGIGIANPQEKLQVDGNMTVSGTISTGNLGMFRNRVINGDMKINQRGFTSASPQTTWNAYSVDRWVLYIGGTPTSISHGQYALLSTTDATMYNQGFRFACVINRGSGGTAVHFRQYIELNMIEDLYNSVCTLSFWARASVSGSFTTFHVKMSDGTTATGTGQNFNHSVTTSWQRFSVVIPIVSPTSSTGALTSYGADLGFSLSPLPNATIFYLTGVQLEKGAITTPFEFRPYIEELRLCQRYFQHIINWTGLNDATTSIAVNVFLIQTMRAPPNIDKIVGSTLNWRTPNVDNTSTTWTINAPTSSTTSAWFQINNVTAGAAGQAVHHRGSNNNAICTATAEF